MEIFSAIARLIGYAADRQKEQQYTERFNATMERLGDINSALTYLASLIRRQPEQTIQLQAIAAFNDARNQLTLEDWLLRPDPDPDATVRRLELLAQATILVDSGLAHLQAIEDEYTRVATVGLYLTGISLGYFIRRKQVDRGLMHRREMWAFVRLHCNLADKWLTRLEARWDRRRRIEPRDIVPGTVSGGFQLRIDGEISGWTGPFDTDEPLVQQINLQREREIANAIYPLYAAVIELRLLTLSYPPEKYPVWYHPGGDWYFTLSYVGGTSTMHPVSLDAFAKWFQPAYRMTIAPELPYPIGRPVTMTAAPAIARIKNVMPWSNRGISRYGESESTVMASTPYRRDQGTLVRIPGSPWLWWISWTGSLHWVASDDIRIHFWPNTPVEDVAFDRVRGRNFGPNIDWKFPFLPA